MKRSYPSLVVRDINNNDTVLHWKEYQNPPFVKCDQQKVLCKSIFTERHDKIIDLLKEKKDAKGLLWFLSNNFKGSGCWLSFSSLSTMSSMSADAFKSNISKRLLINPSSLSISENWTCSACNHNSLDCRFHCLSCTKLNKITIKRHDLIVDDLYRTLKKLVGRNNIERECLLDNNRNLRMDIVVTVNGITYYIDLGVVSPTSTSYAQSPDVSPTQVAQVMECSKRHKYSRTLCQIGVRESHFVPFIMCASGFMGTAASDWFDSLLAIPKFRNPMLLWYKLACHRMSCNCNWFV